LKQRDSNVTTDHIEGRNGGKLRRIPKGTSGNPKGRPKKLPEIDKLLADVLGEEKDGITAADAILRKLRAMAASGNIRAIEILLDRAYGKARQTVEMEVTQRMTIIDDIAPINTAIAQATPSLGPAEG
jgi:hypothetical protein